ncbi:SulP family inorganic anion transporter [Enemella sp. A6]|uniref:SulP family inorganic anion transporter n=1 Tax=Enemella sp. A6 TaxID=3440152 RepID=UPI003EBD2516
MPHSAEDQERRRAQRRNHDVPWWGRVMPGVHVLRHYDRRWLRGDLLAGITVTAYLIPQVMAYAEVAGLPPIVGLWAAIGPLLAYALLGSSRQLSVGPESSTALMSAAAVAALLGAAGGPDRYAAVAAVLAIAVGVICLLGYIARLGFLAELLSRPVLVGYMAGIAALMIVSQLDEITKLELDGSHLPAKLWSLINQLPQAHLPTVVMAGLVVVTLFVFQRWAPNWPGPLIAMLVSAAAVALFGLERFGLTVIGEVPRGLPMPQVPSFDGIDLWQLIPAAVGVAVVGYSDNVLAGRAFASKRGETIDSNQEFLALGAANVASGMMQGFPVSSSGSRTVLGDSMGSRTQLFSLVTLMTVIAAMYLAGPVLAAFPMAALGGVVVYAAIRLVDIAELKRIARFRTSELVLALGTTVAVLLFDVLAGIGIAIALSLLDLFRRITSPHDAILGYVRGMAGMHDIDDHEHTTQIPGLVAYRYDSPLFFANAEDFTERALIAVAVAETPTEWFLLNAEANTHIDLTAVDALKKLREQLEARGIVFAMARVKQEVRDELTAAGFTDENGEHLYATLPTAVAAYAAWYEQKHGHPVPGFTFPEIPPQPIVEPDPNRTDEPGH